MSVKNISIICININKRTNRQKKNSLYLKRVVPLKVELKFFLLVVVVLLRGAGPGRSKKKYGYFSPLGGARASRSNSDFQCFYPSVSEDNFFFAFSIFCRSA